MSSPAPELIRSVRQVLLRDLDILQREVQSFPDEAGLWKIGGAISNSAGTLCLHLCGNLQHFVGAVLGGTGFVRNREHEFNARNVSREELIKEIANTRNAVDRTLSSLSESQLNQDYPVEVLGGKLSTVFFLLHLAAHLNYHLGQVNYHRRLLAS